MFKMVKGKQSYYETRVETNGLAFPTVSKTFAIRVALSSKNCLDIKVSCTELTKIVKPLVYALHDTFRGSYVHRCLVYPQ